MTVLVGTDGSTESQAAFSWAVEHATLTNSSIVVAYVRPFPVTPIAPMSGTELPLAIQPASEGECSELVCRQVVNPVITRTGGPLTTDLAIEILILEGSPASALLGAAITLDADAIVIGHRGQHGVAATLMGSVARQVSEGSDRPVIVVPHTRHRTGATV